MEFSRKLMPNSSPWSQGRKTPSGREKHISYSSVNNTVYVCMVITYSKNKDQPGKVAILLVVSCISLQVLVESPAMREDVKRYIGVQE